jgi:hypothetical protein
LDYQSSVAGPRYFINLEEEFMSKVFNIILIVFLLASVSSVYTADTCKSSPTAAFSPKNEVVKILWQDPIDIQTRDLFWGPGGTYNAPNPSSLYIFIDGDKSGHENRLVEDELGRKWEITFDSNNNTFDSKGRGRASVASSRLMWAVGYETDQNYFLESLLVRDKQEVKKITNVGLKRRFSTIDILGNWRWDASPFNDSRELQGLKTIIALFNNWDTDNNGKGNRVARYSNNLENYYYYVFNLNSSFGKSDSTRGVPNDYANDKLLKNPQVSNNQVNFAIDGDAKNVVKNVSPASARWIASLVSRLSDKQLSDAFLAAGFNPAETNIFVQALKAKNQTLLNLS